MISFLIETTVEDYIWEDFCDNNKIDPEDPTKDDLNNFVDFELGIFPDSVRML